MVSFMNDYMISSHEFANIRSDTMHNAYILSNNFLEGRKLGHLTNIWKKKNNDKKSNVKIINKWDPPLQYDSLYWFLLGCFYLEHLSYTAYL